MKYLFNIKVNILSQIANVILTFLSNLIITKILGDVFRGDYVIIFTFISLFTLIFSFSINNGIIQKISTKHFETLDVVKAIIIYYLFTFFLFYFIIYLLQIFNFSYLYANKINFEFKIIIILLFLFTSLNSAISAVYIANKKIINVNLIIVIFSFISFIIYILFYKIYFLQDQNKLSSLLKVTIIIQFLQLIILLIGVNKIKNSFKFTLKSKSKYLKILIELFSFSFLIYLTNLLAFFTYKVDIWFLGFYKGSSSVGVYSLSVMFAQIVWLIPNAISSIHLAEIVSNKTAQQIKITLLSLKISFYSALLIGLSIYLLSYFFIVSFFGEKFNNVPNIILILFIGVIPFSSMPIISSYLAGVNNYKNNFIISFVVCFITFFLDIFLIPRYGIKGAAIASSISYILGAVLLTSYFLNITNLKLKSLYSLSFSDLNLFFKIK